ncbi:crocetin glucosyltransferase, chloroplastic-like [Cornus florida]|uniref:crocetin glucosyltransferase, chloroplastic-like n=1 Tax=Cornus florida TaxID=4283 RepID=UPI0028994341|nr:crocetin glucosyltransferase, chloroplastic-like [Cornus florida]
MITGMDNPHILLVTIPGQGHINPALQFAKRLVAMDVKVTFVTSLSAIRHMNKTTPTPQGLTLAPFSDGYENGVKVDELENFMSSLRIHSCQAIVNLINASADEGHIFTRVVYTTTIPWIAEVAHDLHIPSTLLWIQPATIMDIYYYYFNGYADVIKKNSCDPFCPIELPGLPVLTRHDLPSLLLPSPTDSYSFLPVFKKHIDILDAGTTPQVLVNTFDKLESDALQAIKKLNMIAIGPLIPSAFLDGKDPSDTSFGGDMFQKSMDCVKWLNSKPESSVIYLSFGTLTVPTKKQMEEMAHGLLDSRRPFLWVVRKTDQFGKNIENEVICTEELEKQGMIVPWCSQVEVLSHLSLGCFVTHCGWNSTLESVVSGVPIVALPQWTDQGTNAKLMTDVWETGLRLTVNEEGIAEREEFKRCIEMVMGDGEKGKKMRGNAKKWKELAREAVKEGGSSDMNLKAFVSEIKNQKFVQ